MNPELELMAVLVVWRIAGRLVVLRVVSALLKESKEVKADEIFGSIHVWGGSDIIVEWLGKLWHINHPFSNFTVEVDIQLLESSVNYSRELV